MSIRWKLNLAFLAMMGLFVGAACVAVYFVNRSAADFRAYSRVRDVAQFVAAIGTDLYAHVAAATGTVSLPEQPAWAEWPDYVLSDIDVQIRLAETGRERELWERLRGHLVVAGALLSRGRLDDPQLADVLDATQRTLRSLRLYYEVPETDLVARLALMSLRAQVAMWGACGLAIVLFAAYLAMNWRWFVRPIDVLKSAAEAIGRGDLHHRIPLQGSDELADLARHLEAMGSSLARHQAALIEARELSAIGELCAHVAHGLRNPLATIRSSAQLVEQRLPDNDTLRAMVRDLIAQADRIDQRITTLFEFSRPFDLKIVPTAPADLAAAVQHEAAPALREHQTRLAVRDETPPGTRWPMDPAFMSEALAEVVANAAHHSPEGSQIVLRFRAGGDANGRRPSLRIEVIDCGVGMSPATAAKAFDLFFTRRPGGTGMGLAMVRRVVQRHGGTIAIDSKPGHGTTVTICLPPAPAWKPAAPPGEVASAGEEHATAAHSPAPAPADTQDPPPPAPATARAGSGRPAPSEPTAATPEGP